MHGQAGRRHVLLGQQLADQALVRSGFFRKVSGMGMVMGARLAGNVCPGPFCMVMEGRKEYDRQDNRQQEQGRYAPFQRIHGCKDTKTCFIMESQSDGIYAKG